MKLLRPLGLDSRQFGIGFSKQEVEADWNTSSLFLFSMQIEIGFKSLSSKCGETPVPHK